MKIKEKEKSEDFISDWLITNKNRFVANNDVIRIKIE